MKTLLLHAPSLILMFSSFSVSAQETDPVKKAHSANEEKAENNVVDEDVAEFLVKSADARMMGSREGKLATKKGTTEAIRDYGQWMIKDQAILLKEIKRMAATRNITLPTNISEEKEEGREKLADKEGTDFDEKFVKMMTIDHERDVKLFEKALQFKDKGVSSFARKYLPTIQAHLNKIEAIKDLSN